METFELLGRRVLNKAVPEDYAKWAEGLLLDGQDGEYIKIVAAMTLDKPVYLFELEDYFQKALKELRIQHSDKSEILKEYSEIIAKQIISKQIEPRKGLRKLCEIYVGSNYNDLYSNWDRLEDEICCLETSGGTRTHISLNKGNIDEYIKKEAELFLRLLEISLPEDFFYRIICNNCQDFELPKHERTSFRWLPVKWYRRLFLRFPQFQMKCKKCGSTDFIDMSTHEGMKLFIDLKKYNHDTSN